MQRLFLSGILPVLISMSTKVADCLTGDQLGGILIGRSRLLNDFYAWAACNGQNSTE